MRTISAQSITDTVAQLCIKANTQGTQLHEHAGHAGVLTDGQVFFLCGAKVRPQQV